MCMASQKYFLSSLILQHMKFSEVSLATTYVLVSILLSVPLIHLNMIHSNFESQLALRCIIKITKLQIYWYTDLRTCILWKDRVGNAFSLLVSTVDSTDSDVVASLQVQSRAVVDHIGEHLVIGAGGGVRGHNHIVIVCVDGWGKPQREMQVVSRYSWKWTIGIRNWW